ncbi:MAG: TIGR02757 family protein [Bacteroidota bacterium]|nr:TIGR02757 family protein [Bacteroidota bacterium]
MKLSTQLNGNTLSLLPYSDIKYFLDSRVNQYNCTDFIHSDPIQIPHRFSQKEDIEIAAFLSATIAWGQRKSIINNANRLMELMDNSPYEFIMESITPDIDSATLSSAISDPTTVVSPEWEAIRHFVHRTFNGDDCLYFLQSIRNIYLHHHGLEDVFTTGYHTEGSIYGALKHFRRVFLSLPHAQRVQKHISDVTSNSSAKRLNMFLRWMVRTDEHEVDFGLWKNIPASALMLPLDVHTGNVGRGLGLLQRRQNDWKAVEEITSVLRTFDPSDPIKYDFALFGIGAFEGKEVFI